MLRLVIIALCGFVFGFVIAMFPRRFAVIMLGVIAITMLVGSAIMQYF